MKKFKFSETKEGETYLLYDERYDTGKRVVCVYDHTKRLMPPMKKYRPLKYFVNAGKIGNISAEQVEQYMKEEVDSKARRLFLANMFGLWNHNVQGITAGYSLFATE